MKNSTRNILVILVLAIACLSQAAYTKCPYNVEECVCNIFDNTITCKDLRQLPPVVTGSNVTVFTTAIFDGGNITIISRNRLPPGIQVIEFKGHPLDYIPNDAFENSATTLRSLTITGAKPGKVPDALLKLTNLTTLHIADMPIERWDIVTLQHIATKLTDLELKNVSISSWPNWLSFFHLLESLSLSYNSLNSIPDDAFIPHKDSLTDLQLQFTGLTHVPQALSNLTNLTSLDLSGNDITDVHEVEQLALLPFGKKLSTLNINGIWRSEILDFSNMTGLTTVRLGWSWFADPTIGSFPPSVSTLELPGNDLHSVPPLIANMSNLSNLDLSFNEITEITSDMFPSNLTYLYLGYNNITEITNTSFTGFSQLVLLGLEGNPLSIIPASAFLDLGSLMFLYLDRTNLTEIPMALTSLANLKLLTASDIFSLSCPCPTPPELVRWYAARYTTIAVGECDSGRSIMLYLHSACEPAAQTTTHGGALTLKSSELCSYGSVLLLLALWVNRLK